jgi:hypothetical protein
MNAKRQSNWRQKHFHDRRRLDVTLPRELVTRAERSAGNLGVSLAGFVSAAIKILDAHSDETMRAVEGVEKEFGVRFDRRKTGGSRKESRGKAASKITMPGNA